MKLLKDRKALATFFLIILLAFFTRIVNLTKLPIFADEAIYVRWSQVMRADQNLRFLPLSDGKQPLFMWATIPFLKIFSDPLIAGRLLSTLSGMGTIVGIFFLSFELLQSKKVALVGSLIYALSPYAFFFDRMALVDSLLTFFVIWTAYFAVKTVRTLRLDFAMLAGFTLGGALLTKSPALFVVLTMPVLLVLHEWSKSMKKNTDFLIRVSFLFGVTYIIGYGLMNILRLGPNFHMIALRNVDYVLPITHILQSPFDPLLGHLKDSFSWFYYLGPLPLILLLPLGLYNLIKQNWKALIVLLVFVLFPFIAELEYAKVFTARYLLFILPFVAIIVSSTFLIRSKSGVLVAKLIFSGFVIFSVMQNLLLIVNPQKAFLPTTERTGYLEEWSSGYGIREVSNYLRNEHEKNPGKTLIVGTEGYFGTLPDGLQIYLNDIPDIKIIGVGLDLKEVPSSLEESKKFGNKTYLVINSTRLKADSETLNLTKIAEYPKALKENGQTEKLLFFEVTNNGQR